MYFLCLPVCAEPSLGKAVEYFNGGQWHEADLAFTQLAKHYTLPPRRTAQWGYALYRDQQYRRAAERLAQALPHTEAYAPREHTLYTFALAESLFALERYDDAIPYYIATLPAVEGVDSADVCFHLALAYYQTMQPHHCAQALRQAISAYQALPALPPDRLPRLRQAQAMLKGLETDNEK